MKATSLLADKGDLCVWYYLNNDLEVSNYLPAQEDHSLLAHCWDSCPSALLNLIPTADRCCLPDNAMASSPGSPYGTIYVAFKVPPGADTSMSSAAVSPARTSVSPAREQGFLAIAAAYGQSSPALLGKYDPATHSLKTFQHLLFED